MSPDMRHNLTGLFWLAAWYGGSVGLLVLAGASPLGAAVFMLLVFGSLWGIHRDSSGVEMAIGLLCFVALVAAFLWVAA